MEQPCFAIAQVVKGGVIDPLQPALDEDTCDEDETEDEDQGYL
jgi:hypothetical protein